MAKKDKKGRKAKGGTIEVFTVSAPARAGAASAARFGVQVSEVDVSKVTGNLQNVISRFQDALTDIPASKSGFGVDAVALNLSVSAQGKIGMIAGGSLTATAGIAVTFKRQAKP